MGQPEESQSNQDNDTQFSSGERKPAPSQPQPQNSEDKLSSVGNPASARNDSRPMIDFATLSKGAREVVIEHDGQVYRLRMTRNNKLILQK